MSDIQAQRRIAILANPTETPKIECKSWLDLSDQHDKAVLAKAAIALANSGGGVIVFGIVEDETQAKHFNCVHRPDEIKRYTPDAIGSAINQYAEPSLDFRLEFENHLETGNEHAFVEIAGGMQQPVFAKKQLDGVIRKFACYIRKPGPMSEEPHTAQEWSDLLQRCVLAKRKSLLDSIRTIIDGRPMDTTPAKFEEDKLREFMTASKECWQGRLDEVDEDGVARLKYGYWVFAFSILGGPDWPSLNSLLDALRRTVPDGLSHRLFNQTFSRPYAADGAVEAWTGHIEKSLFSTPNICRFWRATLGGQFYHLEGFFEDGYPNRGEPGTRLYTDRSIKLHAMMLKLTARIARSVAEEAEIVICSELTGLKGRHLADSQDWWPVFFGDKLSSIETILLQPRRLALQQINDNLVEILYDFLYPLYENFDFYELKREQVESAVETVNSDGW